MAKFQYLTENFTSSQMTEHDCTAERQKYLDAKAAQDWRLVNRSDDEYTFIREIPITFGVESYNAIPTTFAEFVKWQEEKSVKKAA